MQHCHLEQPLKMLRMQTNTSSKLKIEKTKLFLGWGRSTQELSYIVLKVFFFFFPFSHLNSQHLFKVLWQLWWQKADLSNAHLAAVPGMPADAKAFSTTRQGLWREVAKYGAASASQNALRVTCAWIAVNSPHHAQNLDYYREHFVLHFYH